MRIELFQRIDRFTKRRMTRGILVFAEWILFKPESISRLYIPRANRADSYLCHYFKYAVLIMSHQLGLDMSNSHEQIDGERESLDQEKFCVREMKNKYLTRLS